MDQTVLEEILRRIVENKLETVCTDERGKIWSTIINDKEYILLETVKGEVRGGDYHQSAQHDYVLKGRVMWIEKTCLSCPDRKGQELTLLLQGDEYVSQPNMPHMLVSLDESLVLEWLEGIPEKQYYKPFRDKIESKQQ